MWSYSLQKYCNLKRADGNGITLVNIRVGSTNAKTATEHTVTATEHTVVFRPYAWLMVSHCAEQRSIQNVADFVPAHASVREDKVLADDLPVWIPIPPVA